MRKWAKTLPSGSSVLDLGCGAGYPLTSVLVAGGLEAFGIDAAATLVEAFRRNLPGRPVLCEAVQTSRFFARSFDAVLAWGLLFLLTVDEQRRLIERFGEILVPGGRLLFTSPSKPILWKDAITGLESFSLGAEASRKLLSRVGIFVQNEYIDEGENYYFDAVKH